MRSLFIFITISLLIISCKEKSTKSNSDDLEKIAELQGKLEQMKMDSKSKDDLINESLAFFDEIEANLEIIQLKKNEIRIKTENPELTEEDKTYIIQEIKHINFLRIENGRKVNSLNNELKKSGLRIKELENMIERLIKEMETKDQEIEILRNEINEKTSEYEQLFDSYVMQEAIVDELTEQINTGYYSYGTLRELTDNKVIEKKNGFFGIDKKTQLLDDFNEDYFNKIDITNTKEILVEGSKIKFITDHPSTSFSLKAIGNNTKIIINNSKEFWRVSKYLVVLVN